MPEVDKFYRAFIAQAVRHEHYWLYEQQGAVPYTFAGTAMADVSNLLNIIEALTGEDFRKEIASKEV
jgi:hypothetical protein